MTDPAADAARAAAAAFGAFVDIPILQPSSLFLELAGEALRAQAYMLAAEEESALCLRPDMTVPALRHALAAGAWGAPFGLAYDGHVFRKSAREADAEFRQIGAERYAPKAALDDEETALFAAAIGVCAAVNLTPTVRLGDVAVFDAAVDACGFGPAWTRRFKRAFARPGGLTAARLQAEAGADADANPLSEAFAALSQERAETAVNALLREGRIPVFGGRSVAEIAARLREEGNRRQERPPAADALAFLFDVIAVDDAPDAALSTLHRMAKARGAKARMDAVLERCDARWRSLQQSAPQARFSPSLGRGLAYYDGFLFDLDSPLGSIGGGGRYDGLVDRMAQVEGGGPADPSAWGAVGFALRPARLNGEA